MASLIMSRLEKLTNSRFGRTATKIVLGAYIISQLLGCASLKENYTVNRVRFDNKQYAESGEVMTDAGSKEKKKWCQTTAGKIWIVLGLAFLCSGTCELTDDDGAEETQTSRTPPPEKLPGGKLQ